MINVCLCRVKLINCVAGSLCDYASCKLLEEIAKLSGVTRGLACYVVSAGAKGVCLVQDHWDIYRI